MSPTASSASVLLQAIGLTSNLIPPAFAWFTFEPVIKLLTCPETLAPNDDVDSYKNAYVPTEFTFILLGLFVTI